MKSVELIPFGTGGKQEDVMPIDCVVEKDQRQKNIESNAARGLPLCAVQPLKKQKLAIVASAPSVGDYVDMLREWDGVIWGINGAFHWMMHRGIKPHAFVGVDPELLLKDYLVDPPKAATYYLASQVHPGVFDHLKDHNVHLWHMSDKEIDWKPGMILVHGGSSCLTRAPWLGCMLGYEEIHIFGGDSSFTHKSHVYGGLPPSNFCFAEANGKVYKTHKVMLVQACDMVDLVQSFPGTISIHGEGLMQAMVTDLKNSGVLEKLLAEETETIGKMNRKRRRAERKARAA